MKIFKHLLGLVAISLITAPNIAQTVLVKDINDSKNLHGNFLKDFHSSNGKMFFSKNGKTAEVWVTDGTTVGTQNIYTASNITDSSDNDRQWTYHNGKYYFEGMIKYNRFDDGNLYDTPVILKSDGTKAGTVVYFNDQFSGSLYDGIASINGSLYFSYIGYNSDFDITTIILKSSGGQSDIPSPLNLGLINGSVKKIFGVDSTIYFTITREGKIVSLCKLDATNANGYTEVKQLNHDKFEYVVANNVLYFVGGYSSLNSAQELCKIDPITSLPIVVRKINEGKNSLVDELTAIGSTIYFRAGNQKNRLELWKSDGTYHGTTLVKDINPTGSSNPSNLVSKGNTLYFSAASSQGVELWKSNGTETGTVMVKDLNPGSNSSNPSELTIVNNTLLFTANAGGNNLEIYKTDGTSAGTVILKEIGPGYASSFAKNLTSLNGKLLFSAINESGNNVWISDGSKAGTKPLIDLNTGTLSSNPQNILITDSLLFFSAEAQYGRELYKSDGTTIGTTIIKDIHTGTGSSNPESLTKIGSEIYFAAADSNGLGLFKTNGTNEGTIKIKGNFTSIKNLVNYNNQVYFAGNDGINGEELWTSDGTANGTILVKDIEPGNIGSTPSLPLVFKGKLYFSAFNTNNGFDLWESDGTSAGTVLLKDLYPGYNNLKVGKLVANSEFIFFPAMINPIPFWGTIYKMWKSDGTTSGTTLISPEIRLFEDINLESTVINDKLYFTGSKMYPGFANPWETNGHIDGTKEFIDVSYYDARESTTKSRMPHGYIGKDSLIYFYAKEEETHYDPITHEYLYVSDGITATNIGMIGYDATPGVFHNQSLFVKANDEVHGNEIFEYNLVDKTFKLYYDHNAGLLNSNPFLFNFKNQVYMVAENSNNGRELFKLQLPASSSAAIVERSANVDSEIDTKILEVYPNPATDKIYIKSNNDLSINSYKISTLQGRIVENSVKSSNPINEVNLSNLHTGMYILQITLSDNTTTTHKFYKN